MQSNQFDFSVLDIEVPNQTVEKAQVGCFIASNDQDLDCIIVDDTDHRLVLDLSDESAIIRVTVKALSNSAKLGSVSFDPSVFVKHAGNSTRDIWVTLFDHEDDDLYDGNLLEDDAEQPRIKISFTRGSKPTRRKRAATTKTTKVTTKVVETTTVTKEDATKYSVVNLRNELKTKLEELIDQLRNDTDEVISENNERTGVLHNLETVHNELKGEHEQDLAFGRELEALKDQIVQDLGKRRADIEAQKQALLDVIRNLEDETRKSEAEKAEAEEEKARLTAIVETPEDLTEKGFTQEARDLRDENERNRETSDKLATELIAARDERNNIIGDHSDLVGRFDDTVVHFHDELRKVAQTKRSLAFERAGLQRELDFIGSESDYMQRRLACGQVDVGSLTDAFARLTKEYSETDAEFNRYTDLLRVNLKNQDFIKNDLLKRLADRHNTISDLQNESDRQKNQIDHIQNELTKLEQIQYETKFTQLSGDLRKAEEARKSLQDQLESAIHGFSNKINAFADDLAARQKERDEYANKIDDLLRSLNGTTTTINDLKKELENLDTKHATDENRDRVKGRLDAERNSIEDKLKFATDERNKIHGELQDALQTMDEKHRRVEDQEKQIAALRKDIDELKKLIEEKKRIIAELERDIQLAEEEIERLKGIVDDLYRKIADRDDEIERLKKLIDDQMRRIAELEAEIGDEPLPPAPEPKYQAKKGDLVDEMLAQYIQNCPVPVKRLGDGFYLFGTKKIYAKIMNGKLVIRVGGGYMFIEKFIETYADAELIKINAILEKEGLSSIEELDLEEYCLNRNRTSYGNKPGEASPNNRSGKFSASGSMKASLNGTNRSPKAFNASQIVRKL